MVVAARLAWLASQAADGREMRVVLTSRGPTTKVRFTLSPVSDRVPPSFAVLSLLSSFQSVIPECTVVDRGHKFSNGTSEVAFWISQPKGPVVSAAPTIVHHDPVPDQVGEVVPQQVPSASTSARAPAPSAETIPVSRWEVLPSGSHHHVHAAPSFTSRRLRGLFPGEVLRGSSGTSDALGISWVCLCGEIGFVAIGTAACHFPGLGMIEPTQILRMAESAVT